MATEEEENQCPTSTSTRTSAFKRLRVGSDGKSLIVPSKNRTADDEELDPTTKVQLSLVEIGSLTAKQNEDIRSFLPGVGFDDKSSISHNRNQIAKGKENEDARSFLLRVGSDGKSLIAPSRNQIADNGVTPANDCEK
ncbi:hypothetical protein E5676_scaffold546G001640 [Cucumis melo var. makuwa]|uniref:Uncharacterized protein n=1 Tax=Cucumis melo var. makuwa TaxID=1194695 RepID=A0A5A7VJ76_CUCMM|nr:hypothetical protein E6C27_scaffold37G00680 [Cucumis melo var. makuwa]TYJ96515.1 hypothetical protein E5676_scaffold546G001640 [Cucumis melo var. makuwa]